LDDLFPKLLDLFSYSILTVSVVVMLTMRKSQFKGLAASTLLIFSLLIQVVKVQLASSLSWLPFFFLRHPLIYFAIPMSYFLVRSQIKKIEWRDAFHVLPGLLALTVWYVMYCRLPLAAQLEIHYSRFTGNLPVWIRGMDAIAWLVMIPMYVLSLWRAFERFEKWRRDSSASHQSRMRFYRMARNLVLGLAGIGAGRVLIEGLVEPGAYHRTRTILGVLNGVYLVSAMLLLIRFYVKTKSHRYKYLLDSTREKFFLVNAGEEGRLRIPQLDPLSAQTSTQTGFSLPPDLIQSLYRELQLCLKYERVYLQPKLTLEQLAQRIGVSSQSLSFVINQCEQTTFPNLINRHRIEWFVSRKYDPSTSHFSILGLALEAGFNSKSAFYEAFKREKGLTPTEFFKSASQSKG